VQRLVERWLDLFWFATYVGESLIYPVSLSVVIKVILITELVCLLESLLMPELKAGNASIESNKI